VSVVFQREHTQDIVVLVHGLAEVASFLLVRPVGVRVPVLTFYRWRVYVAAVLRGSVCVIPQEEAGRKPAGEEERFSTISGSISATSMFAVPG